MTLTGGLGKRSQMAGLLTVGRRLCFEECMEEYT
jgi:hypothetical protein